MKTLLLSIAVLLLLFATGYTQQTWDTYITSLQMPCYPPLARQARLQGTARIKLVVAGDGSIASAEAVEGNPLLTKAAIDNVRTWKFGTAEGQNLLEPPVVVFDYKLENGSSWHRCATHVMFDSWSKVTVVSNFPPPVD
jgi:TonB family protein